MTTTPPDYGLFVSTDDLDTYLGMNGSIDVVRAELMIDLTMDRCAVYLNPLPDSAKGLVLDIAGRAYTNAQGVAAEGVGPYTVQRPKPGVYLTRAEIRDLKLLGGGGSAFTIDPTPNDAGQGLMPWDQNVTWINGVPLIEDQGDGQ